MPSGKPGFTNSDVFIMSFIILFVHWVLISHVALGPLMCEKLEIIEFSMRDGVHEQVDEEQTRHSL